MAAPPVIGLEYLIEAAGGEQAVVRAAAQRHSRPFRQANPVEVSEILALTLADRAPQAVRQLGNDAWATLQEAARQLALKVAAPPG